ncbi:Peptidase M18, aminopeptidase I [Candidatus Magnetomorum sp. HK-1]|nr:Peptidase M18, aminopeptidase I [Candidatus Magnetomorum sp. HK-1]
MPRTPQRQIRDLQKKLSHTPKNVWECISDRDFQTIENFSDQYKLFLNQSKTEREAIRTIETIAQRNGFRPPNGKSKKICISKNGKCLALAVLGTIPLDQGINIIATHIDAPRLDLKPNPLYEDVNLSILKTHYYGGIRKYQWLARPMAIHGIVIKKNGAPFEIVIGENDADPVFTIPDLLPHLSRKIQGDKKISDGFEGEKLNLIVGGKPLGDDRIKERFKLSTLKWLYEHYGMIEEDFASAELEIVPAGPARDVGLDKSMIGGYAHDDRACAFSALEAIRDLKKPDHTALVLFYDKEEIGSDGATGAKSLLLEYVVRELAYMTLKKCDERSVFNALINARALSGDVNAAIDPNFQEVHEKRNAAKMGQGVSLMKYTGHGGKYGSSDAHAEYIGWIRRLLNEKKIVWQTGELGKIDEGGGGTVAKYLATYGMDVIDCGPPILSMHSPFEIISKGDLFMTLRTYQSFLES